MLRSLGLNTGRAIKEKINYTGKLIMLSRYEIIYRKVVLILVLVPLIFVPVAHAKSIQIGILYDGDSAQFAKLKLRGRFPVGQLVDVRCIRMENDVVIAEGIKTI